MSIGVFDSGVGGLTVHRALTACLPRADFVYLADQAHVPYGARSGEDIVRLTQAGCERLFAAGCNLIVLACNTASAVALRRLQQLWLPEMRQELGRAVNVLGIIVPTIEVATGRAWGDVHAAPSASENPQTLGIFATPATARSGVYEIEIAKRRKSLSVYTEPCPELAGLIEQGANAATLTAAIAKHFAALLGRIGRAPDKAILGSTHYEVAAEIFREVLPRGVDVIRQPSATANALQAYLTHHPEYNIGVSGARRFLTTGRPGAQHELVVKYWGGPVSFEAL